MVKQYRAVHVVPAERDKNALHCNKLGGLHEDRTITAQRRTVHKVYPCIRYSQQVRVQLSWKCWYKDSFADVM